MNDSGENTARVNGFDYSTQRETVDSGSGGEKKTPRAVCVQPVSGIHAFTYPLIL